MMGQGARIGRLTLHIAGHASTQRIEASGKLDPSAFCLFAHRCELDIVLETSRTPLMDHSRSCADVGI